jgi:hypothetical protein
VVVVSATVPLAAAVVATVVVCVVVVSATVVVGTHVIFVVVVSATVTKVSAVVATLVVFVVVVSAIVPMAVCVVDVPEVDDVPAELLAPQKEDPTLAATVQVPQDCAHLSSECIKLANIVHHGVALPAG